MCDKSKKGADEGKDDEEDKGDSDLRETDRRLKRKLSLYLITYRTTVKVVLWGRFLLSGNGANHGYLL